MKQQKWKQEENEETHLYKLNENFKYYECSKKVRYTIGLHSLLRFSAIVEHSTNVRLNSVRSIIVSHSANTNDKRKLPKLLRRTKKMIN